MKYHIIFKFLAIVLCAAFLLGAAASGAGILVMTEADLYQKNADEAYRDALTGYVESYAEDVALKYAAKELGGAGDALVDSYYSFGWHDDVFHPVRIGYTIFDEAGNVLEETGLRDGQEAEYTFLAQPGGSYLKVLSEISEEEYFGTVELPEGTTTETARGYVFDAIPEGGTEIFFVEMRFDDGTTEFLGSPEEYLGSLYTSPEGAAEFFSAEGVNLLDYDLPAYPTYLAFRTWDGQLVYEISSTESVLQEGRYEDGMTYLLLRNFAQEAYTYDAIPPEGCAVANVYVEYADGFAESVGGSPEVGFLDYEDGGWVRFVAKGHLMTPNNQMVTHIKFEDTDGTLVFEARDPEGVGHMYVGEEGHWFRSSMVLADDTPVEETVPDATEVTVPETLSGIVKAHTNIYASASLSSPVTGFLTTGSPVEIAQQVTEEGLSWGWIPASGWVLMDGIELPNQDLPDNAPENSDPELFVEAFQAEVQRNLYIQESPDGEAAVVGTYNRGDIVSVITTETTEGVTWAQTDKGWIPMDQLIRVELPVMEFDIVTIAEDSTEETMNPTEETAPASAEETAVPVAAEAYAPTEPVITTTAPIGNGDYYSYYDYVSGERKYADYEMVPLPGYTVEVQLAPNAFRYEHEWVLIRLVYGLKNQLAYILGASLLLFAIFAVYLCCAAGKKPGTKEVHAGGLNAMPLELSAFIVTCGVVGLAFVGVEGSRYLVRSHTINGLLCGGLCAYGICLLIVAFCFGCAAQFKTPGGYWWRNSLTGRCIRLLGKGGKLTLKGLEKLDEKWDSKLWPGMKKLVMGLIAVLTVLLKKLWKLAMGLFRWLEAVFRKLGKAMNRFYSMLPMTWQWLLAGGAMIFFLFVTVAGRYDTGIVLSILFGVALVIYGAHCFGSLLESAKRMSKGDLDEKVDDKLMVGSFKDFAGELNGLADVAVVAAQKQLRSERMKTELITNVSHDIKTPLTSIINYVDLLQKPHSSEDEEKYLEVLDRQSQRLKKLIDDLMEMSKASTGNMSVDITRVDAAEAVNQALGEFADKLEKARLYPVFRQPEEAVYMMADGRLVWRVMSNLLSNAVKYALPGTRLYVDLQKVDSKVIISMKNISREELNVEADELLERFVRGDISRNTEGSGLGLNIAQSLMELQKGQLQILVDGDLFKVTLIFPGE